MHDTKSTGPGSCSVSPPTVLSLVFVILMASNCWYLALNASVACHGFLHIVGKVCGCLVFAKEQ